LSNRHVPFAHASKSENQICPGNVKRGSYRGIFAGSLARFRTKLSNLALAAFDVSRNSFVRKHRKLGSFDLGTVKRVDFVDLGLLSFILNSLKWPTIMHLKKHVRYCLHYLYATTLLDTDFISNCIFLNTQGICAKIIFLGSIFAFFRVNRITVEISLTTANKSLPKSLYLSMRIIHLCLQ
jgi:hypothetical protein